MKTENKNRYTDNITLFIFIFLLFIQITGCDKISQGDQRRKFEFLYKMNNSATLFREYTGILTYQKDFEMYKKRMNKLYLDVDGMKIISGYQPSVVLKTKFLSEIDKNLMVIQNIEQADSTYNKDSTDTLNIRNDYEIRKMNENVDELINELNEEISRVGKE